MLALNVDHFGINKFGRLDDPNYERVSECISDFAKKAVQVRSTDEDVETLAANVINKIRDGKSFTKCSRLLRIRASFDIPQKPARKHRAQKYI